MKQYAEYKDSGVEWIGEIPAGWKCYPLFAIASENIQKNRGLSCKNLLSLSYGKIIKKDIETNFGLLPESFETYQIVPAGSVVMRLTDLQNDKRSLRTGYVTETGIITSAYLGLVPSKDIGSEYFSYLLHAYDLMKIYYSLGGGVRQTLNYTDIRRLPVIIPQHTEQQAIAAYLDRKTATIDTLIATKQRLIDLLKEKRQAIISEAVTKGLDPTVPMKDSGVEWIGEIPADWDVYKTSHVFSEVGSGTTPKSDLYDYYSDGDVPWLITGDLNDSVILSTTKNVTKKALLDYSVLKKYSAGSIVIAMYGATIGKLGITGIECCTNQACCVLSKPVCAQTEYLFYSLFACRRQLLFLAQGGGQPNINQMVVRELRLCIPSIAEQEKIIAYLDQQTTAIDTLITNITTQIEKLKEYRQAIISEAVTGKVEI